MARLGDYIQEETHPLGEGGGVGLSMIGVSNERGLEVSSRSTSANIARYIQVRKDWFAYNPMRINVGSIGLADDDSKTGYTSPDYTVFSCKDGLLPQYLLRFLKSEYGLEAVARHSSGAVRKRLYFSGLSEIELEIPSIEEQENSISRFQTAEKAAKFILEENSDTVEIPLLKQAILQEAIQGKLTADWRAANPDVEPASELLHRIQAEKARLIAEKKIRKEKPLPEITPEEIPFEIPERWVWCRLGEVSKVWNGYAFPSGAFDVDGIPVIRIGDLQNGRVSLEQCKRVPEKIGMELSKQFWVPEGAILIAMSGATIGKTAINSLSTPMLLNQRVGRIEPFYLSPIYLKHFLDRIADRNLAISYGAAQPNLSTAQINETLLPLPSLREQTAIVERVEALMATCRELESEIERSRTQAADLLQAVLKEAFAPAS